MSFFQPEHSHMELVQRKETYNILNSGVLQKQKHWASHWNFYNGGKQEPILKLFKAG